MSKKCIGCNRELPKQTTICPACGAQQNLLKHYRVSIIVILLAFAGLSYAATLYIDSEASKIKETVKSESDKELQRSLAEVVALKSELESVKSQLSNVNQSFNKLKAENSSSSNQADQILNDLREKLSEAEAESKKQQGRAGWLGRENTRLKAELETLKKQVSALQLSKPDSKDSLIGQTEDLANQSLNADSNTEPKKEETAEDGNEKDDEENSTDNGVEPPASS